VVTWMARTVELAARPASVRGARVFTAGVLGDDGVEASVVELAVLLVSELVTNAVVHARSGVRVTVT
jgi:anti-sigma regulatory factor (Ser/Thr protein kinase)